MLDFLETLRKEHTDDESIRAFTEIENHLRDKKYGLVWEEHAERVDEMLKENIPVFTEDEEKKITCSADGIYNFILEGDNLQSLYLLEKTHKGRIDVIYIDPPYNTGSEDFIYDDNYVDALDGYRHSKWLSFMQKRLAIALRLLSDNGIIMISIDENEVSQLKILCDEIFGEENRLSTHHMQVRYANKSLNEDNDWQPVMEYVLIYAKNKRTFRAKKPSEPYDLSKFCYKITELSEGETIDIGNKTVTIFKEGEWKIEQEDEGRIGLLKETWASGSIVRQSGTAAEFLAKYLIDRKKVDGLNVLYKIHNMGEDGLGYRYVTGPKKADAIRGKFYTGVPLERIEELETGYSEKTRPIPNFYDYSADFGNIRHEGGVSFNNGKKPVKMLKDLINYHPDKDVTVLDFFAGSGSTAHAVLALNNDDGGTRQFIICTNNEVGSDDEIRYLIEHGLIPEQPSKRKKTDYAEWTQNLREYKATEDYRKQIASLDYQLMGICFTKTYPRVKTVITGIKPDGKAYQDKFPSNLKYFRCDWTPRKPEDYLLSNALCLHIKEMIELQSGLEIDNVRNVLILNKSDFRRLVMDDAIYEQITHIWVNQNIIFNSAELERLNALGFRYIPKEFFGQELREAAE